MSKEYQVIPQDDVEQCRHSRPSCYCHKIRQHSNQGKLWTSWVLPAALLVSLASNLALLYPWYRQLIAIEGVSQYAQLARDVPMSWQVHTPYDNLDHAIQDVAWSDTLLRPENGYVALDDEWTESKGLPHAQRWPWDNKKGVYVLTSTHELHCVHIMRSTIIESFEGKELSWPYGHVMHCLNVLRFTVMCNADDTPLYTGPINWQHNMTGARAGIGQPRMCHDWNKLQLWAQERSACFRPDNMNDTSLEAELNRYKHCPDGSTPWKVSPPWIADH